MNRVAVLAVPVVLVLAATAGAAPEAEPPAGTVTVNLGGQPLTLWPYTFSETGPGTAPGTPSDPINLVFLGSDPRAIRQALMSLDGNRPGFPPVDPFNCRWSDAMGDEQATWAETNGWVGAEVQLACEGAPLGVNFRFHLRLFRQGSLTLGAAHFEFHIPGTAEHEHLSWDLARDFVVFDLMRAGAPAPSMRLLIPAGSFGIVRRPIYDALYYGGGLPILALCGLLPPPPPGQPVPVPTSGAAAVLAPTIAFEPVQAKTQTALDVTYDVVTPKPFCNGPADYVRLQGPVHFDLRVHTNPSGMYERTQVISGMLMVTPGLPTADGFVPAGPPIPAEVSEYHRALLTDNYDEVTQQLSQTLLSDPPQSFTATLRAGQVDEFSNTITCDAP
jgi:hypothetical protein